MIPPLAHLRLLFVRRFNQSETSLHSSLSVDPYREHISLN
jgi:hypothetical protein